MNNEKNKITVLLPFYLIEEFKSIFEDYGYNVVWSDNKKELENRLSNTKPDIALEWQYGHQDHTILNLVRKYYTDVPVLLMLNWNGHPPDNFSKLDYVDMISQFFNIDEINEKIHLYCIKPL